MSFEFSFPYAINPAYTKKTAYFCMEYGIHQPLKTYAGGLGFLAGSHMRSAYELRQNMVGIGILWKYGYYDQVRKEDQTMDVLFEEKNYGFLIPTEIKLTIKVANHDVWFTAWYLDPEIFKTAPVFFLTTDLPENDYLAKTISHKLYDSNPETKLAAAILLGAGGCKLLEVLKWEPDMYHLNESHALPLAFYLYGKHKNLAAVKEQLVFTNHTPEQAGNQKTSITQLDKIGFFCGIPLTEISGFAKIVNGELNHTVTALRMSKLANAVSSIHLNTLQAMFKDEEDICEMISITNAQNYTYWHNPDMYEALNNNNDEAIMLRKKKDKQNLFEEVADQCGEIYDEKICTIVFAKRFAAYKRADLLLLDKDRFHQLVTNKNRPVQIIWAGKPYPMDYTAIGVFDKIVDVCKTYSNCATLVGYELRLSKLLKRGADVWLNLPRLTHEASGTSGMSAAMNGAINAAFPDGWFPEFAKDKINSFVVPPGPLNLPDYVQDEKDAESLYLLLEKEILPLYYDYPKRWLEMMKNGLRDVIPQFDSNRMAREYYERLY